MGLGFDNLISPHAYFPLPFSSAPLRFLLIILPAFPFPREKFGFMALCAGFVFWDLLLVVFLDVVG